MIPASEKNVIVGNDGGDEALLRSEIFVDIQGRHISDYMGIQLLRRDIGHEVEFVTIMRFDSLDTVRAFAGEDYEVAVVPPKARALLSRFGPAARDVVRDTAQKRTYPPHSNVGEPAEDLRQFCAALDGACVGSHRWQRVTDSADCIGYHFTRCLWAEIFRELGEPDLGFVMCASDEPAVRAYNHALGFKRTRTLMEGDDLCDHVFYVKM